MNPADLQQAWEAVELEQYEKAEGMLEELRLAHPDAAAFALGYVYAHTGRWAQARATYQELRRRAADAGNGGAEHRAIHQLGMVERLAGNWTGAGKLFRQEQEKIRALGNDDLAVAVNAYELGFVALHLGDFPLAHEEFRRSLHHATRTADLIAVACAYRGLGDWANATGQAEQAAAFWRSARESFTRADNLKGIEGMDDRLNSTGITAS